LHFAHADILQVLQYCLTACGPMSTENHNANEQK
jgi:hypothetical protein